MKIYKTTYDESTKIWSGEKIARNYDPDYSIGRAALEVMQRNGQKIAQICHHNGKVYKYEELADMTKNVAKYFTHVGLQQCDVIGICASNSDYLAPLFFGAMLKGLIASTLDICYTKDDIKHTFGITKPKIVFCDGNVYEKVKQALDECGFDVDIYTMKDHIEGVQTIQAAINYNKAGSNETFEIDSLKNGGTQTAVILCSSGTTGPSKGVTNSHEALLNTNFLDLEPSDRLLCFSSLSWFSGLYTLLWGTLTGLTRIINSPGFSAENLLEIVEKYQVTVLLTPPSQIALTLASPKLHSSHLGSVRSYFLAGGAVSIRVVNQMKPYFPNADFYNAYGMTEACTATARGICVESGRIGQLAPNIMYKIKPSDDDCENDKSTLGPNEIGELFLKTPYKWLGYYGNAEATAAAYDADLWIRSGDLGYFDDLGSLYVVDRQKDVLKYHNYQYYPTELEHVIYELDDVVEVCVCGLPDSIGDDLPAAAIVKKTGSNLTEKDVYEYVAQRMADFKHLRGGVYFLKNIPKTSTGKILRRETRKLCEQLRNELLDG